MSNTTARRRRAWNPAANAILLAACATGSAHAFTAAPVDATRVEGSALRIETVSNRPDMVSGGDVLVRLIAPGGIAPENVVVRLNGAAVSSPFRRESQNTLIGLVSGLRLGANELSASFRTGKGVNGNHAVLRVTNHPESGPVFSGPQESPFYCQTHQFRVYPNGPLLTDDVRVTPCAVPPRVDYVYRNTAGAMVAWNPVDPNPADLTHTVTNDGRQAPYIVRLETGVLNRAIYQIAILHDPRDGDSGYSSWNRRLVYTFGGGCSGGQYVQGNTTGGVLDVRMLSRGFAVASATLNVYTNNCNDVLSAETAMMVKERFVETYGPVRYTIGWGGSGGAVQQYTIADNYPGLLDGLIPTSSFPDLVQTVVADARLLLNYYNKSAAGWTQEDIRRVSGFGTYGQITNNGVSNSARYEAVQNRPGWPNAAWKPIVPLDIRYDPVLNPTGSRPTVFDHNVNTYGTDQNGFALRPLDNVGVQYGLGALNAGHISPAQFLDLNEKIGGYDIDFNFIPSRTRADPRALRAAYATGKVLSGGGGLRTTAILDIDGSYGDLRPAGDVHLKFHHFSTRERIAAANGAADNVVMWSGGFGANAGALAEGLDVMDRWLSNIESDRSSTDLARKVVRNKPEGLTDGCYTESGFVAERQFHGSTGSSRCNTLYPSEGYPLEVAGGPLTNDVLKCTLKPIDLSDYHVPLTTQELERLAGIFPDGVCDWRVPGAEQTPLAGTWLRYLGGGTYQTTGR